MSHLNTKIKPTRPAKIAASFLALLLVAAAAASMAPSPAHAAQGDITVYDDALGPDFQNWSWGADVDLANTNPVGDGSHSVAVTYNAWGGLFLAAPGLVNLSDDAELSFLIRTPASTPTIQLQVLDSAYQPGPGYQVDATDGQWERHTVPIADLGGHSESIGMWWQLQSGNNGVTIHLDDITITASDGTGTATGPALTVDAGTRSLTRTITDPGSGITSQQTLNFPHPISDGVYGLNFAEPSLRAELDLGVNRWGGNGSERYNYTNGNSNKGKDYYFMGDPSPVGGDDAFENANQANGTDTLMTVPLMGWAANSTDATCSYPVTDIFGSQHNASPMDSTASHWADGNVVCGDGIRNGSEIPSADPSLTSVATDPTFVKGMVDELVATNGPASAGGVEAYALGNEPGLWHITHRDIRPDPIGRDELIDRAKSYANAIKAADASADVYGPVSWGGYSYFVTPEEFDQGKRPGQVPTLLADYLDGMATAETQVGQRLLDGLAINFYDDRVYWAGASGDSLRVRSPRSLWDPSYAPSDWWPVRDFIGGEGFAVIPRMRSLIDRHYPGTKLAITEYNFGRLDSMAGAVAQADALGIFGREGLDIATLWDPYNEVLSGSATEFADKPGMHAFRMFRNYDGSGGKFGDRSLFAESADPDKLSVYAAERTSDGALTVMVVNLSTSGLTSELTLDGADASSASVYRYDDDNLGAIADLGTTSIDSTSTHAFPGRSITLFVITDDDDGNGNTDDCHRGASIVGALPSQPEFATCTVTNTGAGTSNQSDNTWLDDFNHGLSFADMAGTAYKDYAVNLDETKTWRHADHWMVDIAPHPVGAATDRVTGATFLRPDKTFRFDDAGKLVVEMDVAAGIDAYDPSLWPEIVVTTGSEPTERRPDGLYAYDHFRDDYTLGCRLQADHNTVCALMDANELGALQGGRLWETSFFQDEALFGESGEVTGGGDFVDQRQWFRHCEDDEADANCRDRFRLELSRKSLTIYVNGNQYFRNEGKQLLPDDFMDQDLYIYAASVVGSDDEAIRFHWDRFAVNPGTGYTPSPTYN